MIQNNIIRARLKPTEINLWGVIGRVTASSYRKKVLKSLTQGKKTPTDLQKETGIKASHISKTLAELRDMRLIKLYNPKARKSKIYGITKLGEKIWALAQGK